MDTQPLFDLNIHRNFYFDWHTEAPPLYKGVLLPQTQLRCICGGFGDMVFQYNLQSSYSIWYNHYDIQRRINTHARLDRPLIELSFIMEPAINFSLMPFGRLSAKNWQFNLMTHTEMDSRVQFDSGTRTTTLDIHPEVSMLESLFESFPDLVGPLLEAVHAGKPMLYFPGYIYASPEMVQTVYRILQLLAANQSNELLQEFLVSLLLVQGMELKAREVSPKMRYDRVLQVRKLLNYAIRIALMDLSRFHGYDYYAARCSMCATNFKKYMREFKGTTLRGIWENVRIAAIADTVAHTDKLLLDIALEYGFMSMTGFNKAFKRKTGLAPKALRNFERGSRSFFS